MILLQPAQERQMPVSPQDDVIIVARRHRPAHHQKQHLAERIQHLAGLPSVPDL